MRVIPLISQGLLCFCIVLSSFSYSKTIQSELDSQPINWLLEQIRIGEAQEKPQLVIDSLERLFQVEANNLDGLASLARYQFSQGLRSDAISTIDKIEGISPNHKLLKQLLSLKDITGKDRNKLQQARLLSRAGRYQESKKLYLNLFKHGFPTPKLKYEYITVLAQDPQKWGLAHKKFRSLTKEYPSTPRYEVALAKHRLEKDPTHVTSLRVLRKYASSPIVTGEVESIWLRALSNMPINDKTAMRYNYFISAFPKSPNGKLQRDNFKIELAQLKKLQRDPFYKAWISGKTQMENENYSSAKIFFDKALTGRPSDPEILGSMGLLYLKQGLHLPAIKYFKLAAKSASSQNDKDVWLGLSKTAQFWGHIAKFKVKLGSKNFDTAEKHLNQALKLNEDNQTVLSYLAQLHTAKGDKVTAQKIYQKLLLDDELNEDALIGLLDLVILSGEISKLESFSQSLSQKQARLIQDKIQNESVSIYRDSAEKHNLRGELPEAIFLLEKAIAFSPKSSWLYYDLSKIHQKQGNIDKAKTVFKKASWQFPLDSDIRFAQALFLSSTNDYKGAINSLNQIPLKLKTEASQALKSELQIRYKLQNTDQMLKTQAISEIESELLQIQSKDNLTPSLRADLALSWYKIDKLPIAIKQLGLALDEDPTFSAYWHLLEGEWLLESQDKSLETNKRHWFENSFNIPVVTNDDKQALDKLIVEYKIQGKRPNNIESILTDHLSDRPYSEASLEKLVEFHIQNEDIERTQTFFTRLNKIKTPDIELQVSVAQLSMRKNHDEFGESLIEDIVNMIPQTENYLQTVVMDSLLDFKSASSALPLMKKLVALNPHDPELLNLAGQVATKFDSDELALKYYSQVLTKNGVQLPDDNKDFQEQFFIKIAQSKPNDAWYVNSARSGISNIYRKGEGHIAIGIDFNGQTSTQSEATLGVGSTPVEAYFPFLDGQLFVKSDPIAIKAQITDFTQSFSATRYGTGLFCYPNCSLHSIQPQDRGVDFAIGWQNENWRIDIGTTPLGFLIEDISWGVEYLNSIGDFSWDLAIEKRPVTGSVLSYGGYEDIETNQVWGGVRSTGVSFGLYHDLGLDWGFWSNFDVQKYTGVNVKENSRYAMLAGSYYRVIVENDLEVSVGMNLSHWAYKYNLSEETFGHGGYYSPQSYYGISFPASLDARWGDLIYRLRAGISYSQSETDTIEFFPNDPELQLQAISIVEQTEIEPYYEGSKSSGLSYNLGAEFEYQLTPQWFVGGILSIDRADFYEPNFGQLYLRYNFNPLYGPIPFSPKPIVPYSSF
jgi:tetratricopeptide (TPR) repeat protein